MYKCLDCGNLFEAGEEKVITETYEHFGTQCEGRFYVCPVCDGNYHEVKPCKICGSYEHDYGEDYCNDCKQDVQKRFSAFIEEEFTEEERELLNELYEGEWI